MTPGRGSTRAMWVNRDTPKWSEVHRTLPHDEVWRTTGELFTLAQRSGLVRPGDNMGSLIASMRNHNLAESQSGKPMKHRLLTPEEAYPVVPGSPI